MGKLKDNKMEDMIKVLALEIKDRFMKDLPRILKWLGFDYGYKLELLGAPELDGGTATYNARIVSKELKWLNFTIKRYGK